MRSFSEWYLNHNVSTFHPRKKPNPFLILIVCDFPSKRKKNRKSLWSWEGNRQTLTEVMIVAGQVWSVKIKKSESLRSFFLDKDTFY